MPAALNMPVRPVEGSLEGPLRKRVRAKGNRLSLSSSWISFAKSWKPAGGNIIFTPGFSTCTQVFLPLSYQGVQRAKTTLIAACFGKAFLELNNWKQLSPAPTLCVLVLYSAFQGMALWLHHPLSLAYGWWGRRGVWAQDCQEGEFKLMQLIIYVPTVWLDSRH